MGQPLNVITRYARQSLAKINAVHEQIFVDKPNEDSVLSSKDSYLKLDLKRASRWY